MSTKPLPNFDEGIYWPKGADLQKMVDAIAEIDDRVGHDISEPPPKWALLETFPAIIYGLYVKDGATFIAGAGTTIKPAMYRAQRCVVGAGLTNDTVYFYRDPSDVGGPADNPGKTNFEYAVTNINEILDGSNVAEMGQNVLAFAIIDNSPIQRRRYLFFGEQRWRTLQITDRFIKSLGTGTTYTGIYKAKPAYGGASGVTYPANLNLLDKGEDFTNPNTHGEITVIFENIPESKMTGGAALSIPADGDPPLLVQALLVGYTDGTDGLTQGSGGNLPTAIWRGALDPSSRVVWIKITSPIGPASMGSTDGGGGYYNCRPLTGRPTTIDPTLNLNIPTDADAAEMPPTGEEPAATDTGLAENTLEANLSPGDEPSHWVPYGTIVPAWIVGKSNETPARTTYRFALPIPGTATTNIIAALGSIGGAGGNGRYAAVVIWSRPTAVAVATTNLALPDHGETTGAPAEDPASTLKYYVCYENGDESNIATTTIAGAVNLMPVDGSCYIEARPTGGYGTTAVPDGYANSGMPIPIYRGYTPPQQALIAVTVSDDGSGSNATNSGPGTAWIPATYKYNVFTLGGVQILAGVSPSWARPQGPLIGPAFNGMVCILPNGTLKLLYVDEQLAVNPECTPPT